MSKNTTFGQYYLLLYLLLMVMKVSAINHVLCASCSLGFFAVSPEGESLKEQVTYCLDNLTKYLAANHLPHTACIRQTYFVRAQSNEEVRQIQTFITDFSFKKLGMWVPLSIVPQPPLGTSSQLVAEYACITDATQIEQKTAGNTAYLKISSPAGTYLSAAGLNKYLLVSNILEQSIDAFEQMNLILKAEDFTFGDIVRQWNYIERIIDFTDNSQHYQIFNDVRSNFYGSSTFPHGYPAATGIGMSFYGIILEFLAFKPAGEVQIIPIQSPVQTNAHQYSPQVLSSNQYTHISCIRSTPKFERAKAVIGPDGGILFVSGTAAIKGELSASQYDAAMQTRLTLQNIDNLISHDNLERNGIQRCYKAKPLLMRVYVKNPEDIRAIKSIVDEYAIHVPILYLQADICRPELLVEIEGVFQLYP